MSARSLILAAVAATQLPCQVLAQGGGFIGIGGGASHVTSVNTDVRADNRASIGARVGYGGSRVKVVLDYQRHGLGDEDPLPSDLATARIPQILETDFLLLGAQIYVHRGLYVRPALGMGWTPGVHYGEPEPELVKEAAAAAGASLGYHLKIHPRFSLGIEASGALTVSAEGQAGNKVFGIQVSPLFDF